MSAETPTYARAKATIAGAIAGIGLSSAAALVFFGVASATPYNSEHGLTPLVIALMAAPGVIMIATIFAFPASALLVWLMDVGVRRVRLFDNCVIWAISGCAVSFPAAWLFGQFERPNQTFEFNYGSGFIFGVAAISAVVAWLFRKSGVSS